jgi:C-terminal processing protease CtpA/Prc
MPAGFTQRLGRASSDFFYSGTLEVDGVKLGFIRVPNFSPPNAELAIQQFAMEIQYFQANTEGLIVDDTRNTGGSVCLVEQLLSFLIPQDFRGGAFEIRATSFWVAAFSSSLVQMRAAGAPEEIIDRYEALLAAVRQANDANRGRTPGLPLCSSTTTISPARDRSGNLLAYTKPVVMLVDDLSASSGDIFPALFQDAKRGPVMGYRTMGLGGTVVTFPDATTYSEGDCRITLSMMTRAQAVQVDEFPSSAYIENIGVRPDVVLEYQTRDNLMNAGKTWIETAAWLAAQHVKAAQ